MNNDKKKTSLWVGGSNKPQAKIRLFCFPAAGGSSLSFREWEGNLPPYVELCPIKLPGREARFTEDLFEDAQTAAKALAEGLEPFLDIPFAFFGHSMGSVLAFEVIRELRRSGRQMPFCLFVSGRRAPRLPLNREPFHTLTDSMLIKTLRTYFAGGTPEAVLQEKELMALFLPVIRADLMITDAYHYSKESLLECPIYAFSGEMERDLPIDDLDAWQEETSGNFSRELFPGGHFYLNESSQPALLRRISDRLNEYSFAMVN